MDFEDFEASILRYLVFITLSLLVSKLDNTIFKKDNTISVDCAIKAVEGQQFSRSFIPGEYLLSEWGCFDE